MTPALMYCIIPEMLLFIHCAIEIHQPGIMKPAASAILHESSGAKITCVDYCIPGNTPALTLTVLRTALLSNIRGLLRYL